MVTAVIAVDNAHYFSSLVIQILIYFRVSVTAAAIAPQTKNKPPQQILPKPITNIVTQTTLKPQTPQPSPAGTLLLNQVLKILLCFYRAFKFPEIITSLITAK